MRIQVQDRPENLASINHTLHERLAAQDLELEQLRSKVGGRAVKGFYSKLRALTHQLDRAAIDIAKLQEVVRELNPNACPRCCGMRYVRVTGRRATCPGCADQPARPSAKTPPR